jgi:acetyl esterase/lipase
VVKYRLCPEQQETAEGRVPDSVRAAILADGPRAVRLVRANAEAWGIDPERIGVMGFSAGGYMATWSATHYDSGRPESSDPVERASSRPDFAGLIYPAVPAGIDSVISADTPPVFLVNANDDQTTPAVKAIALHGALSAAGVTTEMHIFTRGGHGFGLGVDGGALTAWPGLFEAWLREQGVIGEK